jgi:CheY-like chemotaxis protein
MSEKILVIDDDELVLMRADYLLSGFGYETCTIAESTSIIDQIQKCKPDLVLLDLHMPGANGIVVLEELRSSARYKDLPVIIMTGNADETTHDICFDMGASDILLKPLEAHILRPRVKSALDRKRFLREIRKKNEEIEQQNKDILEGIRYGQTIQQALLVDREKVHELLPQSFIFFKPRHLVSGDFYWVSEVDDKIYVAAIDCTGHGVPGAFMSMLGYALMNQLIHVEQYTDPADILNGLHYNVRKSLKQDEKRNNDGMDMGICVIDKTHGTLSYAGAYNILLVVSAEGSTTIDGDKFPVGGMHHRFKGERNFASTTIPIHKDSRYYMYTDGFPDQFGGENGRKFMKKYLHQLLESMFARTLEEWRGQHPQIDDVLVMGFSLDDFALQ